MNPVSSGCRPSSAIAPTRHIHRRGTHPPAVWPCGTPPPAPADAVGRRLAPRPCRIPAALPLGNPAVAGTVQGVRDPGEYLAECRLCWLSLPFTEHRLA